VSATHALGHSTPNLTLGTYGHVLKAHQQEAARQMEDALSSPPEEADVKPRDQM
jgi:integrase